MRTGCGKVIPRRGAIKNAVFPANRAWPSGKPQEIFKVEPEGVDTRLGIDTILGPQERATGWLSGYLHASPDGGVCSASLKSEQLVNRENVRLSLGFET